MPFYYYGAKKMLARHYDAPRYDTIIEPFAGSAAYALHYATPDHRVILVERDERVAGLWHRLQAMSLDELQAIECPPQGERCSEPLINLAQVSQAAMNARFYDAKVTSRMARDWPRVQRSLATALPKIRNWEVVCGDYTEAPDIEATWFVDPPYWVPDGGTGTRGSVYRFGASTLDFGKLGAWCRSRLGQTVVCEQRGAPWLPFRDFRMHESMRAGVMRMEVVWTQDTGLLEDLAA